GTLRREVTDDDRLSFDDVVRCDAIAVVLAQDRVGLRPVDERVGKAVAHTIRAFDHLRLQRAREARVRRDLLARDEHRHELERLPPRGCGRRRCPPSPARGRARPTPPPRSRSKPASYAPHCPLARSLPNGWCSSTRPVRSSPLRQTYPWRPCSRPRKTCQEAT